MSIAILPSNAILHLPSPRVCHEECSIGNSRASRVVRRQDFIRVQVMPQEEETLWIPVSASQTALFPSLSPCLCRSSDRGNLADFFRCVFMVMRASAIN